jgi:hypothetical protein
MKIFKYKMPIKENVFMELPMGAQLLDFKEQHNGCYLWAMVDPKANMETVHFRILGTGVEFDCESMSHVGTLICANGYFVWHLFRVT